MNSRQKEILQAQLNSEKAVLKQLESNYEDALAEINSKIELLMARQDADMQHVIYQVEYQKALKTQIQAILETLQANEFETVSQYLTQSYEDGFIGTMYDLQGQGIPLIFPIDQQQVVEAIQNDTKLSENLYTSLGHDMTELKKRITGEISRGLSSGQMYSEIARNVSNWARIPKNNAMRIARTEAHRIQCKATYDAQHKAKDKGADVVKQWDSSLDGKTRPNHRKLDGQIRELDEPFEVNGHKAMYPSGFGRPEEDINCRCAILQRARWALGNDYTKWDEEAPIVYSDDGTAQLAIIEAKNYKDFQEKYKQAVENVKNSKKTVENSAKSNKIKLDTENYSDAFKTKSEKKNTQKLVDYVNELPDADANVLKLYNSIGKLEKYNEHNIDFLISHASNYAVSTRASYRTKELSEVKLTIPKLSGDNLAGQVNTTLHEQMHLIDLMLKDEPTKSGAFFSETFEPLRTAVKNTNDSIGDEVKKLFDDFHAELKSIRDKATKEFSENHNKIKEQYLPNGVWGTGADYNTYKKEYKKLEKDFKTALDYNNRNALGGGINNLEDIYDALSHGQYREKGTVKYGHGRSYYSDQGNIIDEIVANYGALSVSRPDLINMLKKDKPELVKSLEELVEEMGKKV